MSVWSMGRLPEGNSRAFGVVGPMMLLSVEEMVCHGDVKMQVENYDIR